MSSRPTETLCPVCLRKLPALLVSKKDRVCLEASCPDHGAWETPVWCGPPSLDSWLKGTCCSGNIADAGPSFAGCPGECGLCADHGQRTCTAVLEVTQRCNLTCPVCFADASGDCGTPDPAVAELRAALEEVFALQGPVNLQLSGGEPTMRADLAEIVGAAKAVGFTFVQLNTNGLRMAAEPGYARELRDAGLESVFLQFDGLTDDIYVALRGRSLLEQKLAAVEACAEAGLGIVLVPTVVAGVNDAQLGDLIRFATQWPAVVRGVHLQPVSYFGRFPANRRPRLTMPEVMQALEKQTEGAVKVVDFKPSGCEHTRCSFRARYWLRAGGRLELVRSEPKGCCPPQTGVAEPAEPGAAAKRAIAATSRQWRAPGRGLAVEGAGAPSFGAAASCGGAASCGAQGAPHSTADEAECDALTRFLDEADRILCISGMLFQDAWSIDLERVRRCCVHSVVPGRGLVPFCLWNLTSESGERLYPR